MRQKSQTQQPVPGAGHNIYWLVARKKFRVIWKDRGRQREKNFPADTPVKTLIAFRNRMETNAVDAAAVTAPKGGFVRDVVVYLRSRLGLPCYKSEKSHMRPWCTLFRTGSRHVVTREQIQTAITEWRKPRPNLPGRLPATLPPIAPKTVLHRVNVLRQMFRHHDGPDSPTPCYGVKLPKVPKTAPVIPPDDLVATVAANLKRQEDNGRLRDGKTRARYLVLATTGKRPCQMQNTPPDHVNVDTRTWIVPPAKHSNGGVLYLNDEMLAAWKLFITANAWGPYDSRSFSLTLRRNGWPGGRGGIRPYNMRHGTLQAMSEQDAGLDVIQQAAGHTTPVTTKKFYLQNTLAKSKRAGDTINGRFDAELFTARAPKDFDQPEGGT